MPLSRDLVIGLCCVGEEGRCRLHVGMWILCAVGLYNITRMEVSDGYLR